MAPVKQSHTSPLVVALDLYETGVALMRQNLKRQFPDADERDVDRRLQVWLRHRPGAEHGDAEGRALDPRTRFP